MIIRHIRNRHVCLQFYTVSDRPVDCASLQVATTRNYTGWMPHSHRIPNTTEVWTVWSGMHVTVRNLKKQKQPPKQKRPQNEKCTYVCRKCCKSKCKLRELLSCGFPTKLFWTYFYLSKSYFSHNYLQYLWNSRGRRVSRAPVYGTSQLCMVKKDLTGQKYHQDSQESMRLSKIPPVELTSWK